MIRVVLVDDHTAFRQALAFMIDRDPEMTVIGDAGSVIAARPMMRDFDIAVIDLDLDGGDGVDLIEEGRFRNPSGAVLVLTGSRDPLEMARAIDAGAVGVLHKSAGVAGITDAIRRMSAGEQVLDPADAVELMRYLGRHREEMHGAEARIGRLTPREREVLAALALGLSDSNIGRHLGISTETVRTHMVNILGKLEVESRVQALLFALRHGLVELGKD